MTTPLIKTIPVGTEAIPVIRDIAYRTWPSAYGEILVPAQIEYMLDSIYSVETLQGQIERLRHRFWLALAGDQPVGYLGYERDAVSAGITRIHKLYVLPESHGLGVGRALLDAAIAEVVPQGQHALRLNVNRFNPSVRFYERNGFLKIGEEDLDFGGGYYMNDFIMERRLETSSYNERASS